MDLFLLTNCHYKDRHPWQDPALGAMWQKNADRRPIAANATTSFLEEDDGPSSDNYRLTNLMNIDLNRVKYYS